MKFTSSIVKKGELLELKVLQIYFHNKDMLSFSFQLTTAVQYLVLNPEITKYFIEKKNKN